MRMRVRRGYITRFDPREEWDEDLEPVPPGSELTDGDAIPYYVEPEGGGPLVEFYGYEAPPGVTVYRRIDDGDAPGPGATPGILAWGQLGGPRPVRPGVERHEMPDGFGIVDAGTVARRTTTATTESMTHENP